MPRATGPASAAACNTGRGQWGPHAKRGAGRVRSAPRDRKPDVQHDDEDDDLGRGDAHPRDRQGRPPGRWRGGRHPGRDLGAGGRYLRQGAEARSGLLSADRPLPGEILCRGQGPGRLLQARGAADREGDTDRAADRPADPAALRAGLQERGPGDVHGPLPRPGQRSRHRRDDRGLGGADDLRGHRSWARSPAAASASRAATMSSTPMSRTCTSCATTPTSGSTSWSPAPATR